jgi:enoyl-CoA hydratase
MARPEAHNTQGLQMTYELNAAFDRAAQDDDIKVIILAGDGRNFSAGHDLSGDGGTDAISTCCSSLWWRRESL